MGVYWQERALTSGHLLFSFSQFLLCDSGFQPWDQWQMICKNGHLQFPPPLYAKAILPIKRALLCLGRLIVSECGRSDAVTITNCKKGQFLSHCVRKEEVQAVLLGRGTHAGSRSMQVLPSAASTILRIAMKPQDPPGQVSVAHTMWDRDEHSSLSSAANGTSAELQANKRIDVISH